MRLLVFPLVDEVWIEDNQIIVRNRGAEERFPITNIMSVETPLFLNPERVVLTLKEPCGFGREIVFTPSLRWWHFSRHPIAEELIRRAHDIDEKQLNPMR
jgi:hypothetical protein